MSQSDLELLEELKERAYWDPSAEKEIEALQRKMGMIWTSYHDMHTGGDNKTDYDDIYINAPKEEAAVIFKQRFGFSPESSSCDCGTCGPDFNEVEGLLDEITCYDRNCNYVDNKWKDEPDPKKAQAYQSLEQFKSGPKRIFIESIRKNPIRRRKTGKKQRGCKHSDKCAVCKKTIEFIICRRKPCFIEGRHYAMWETTPAKWKKLPSKYRSKILCKKCFKKLSGISAGAQWWGD